MSVRMAFVEEPEESDQGQASYFSEEGRAREVTSDSVESALAGVRAEFAKLLQENNDLKSKLGLDVAAKADEDGALSQDLVRRRMSRRVVSLDSSKLYESEASNADSSLPLWPACLLPRYDGSLTQTSSRSTVGLVGATQHEVSLAMFRSVRQASAIDLQVPARTLPVLHPNSMMARTLDATGLLVTLFEVISAPFVLAWDVSTEGPLLGLSVAAVVFWLLDIAMGFNTGVYAGGRLEMRRPHIIRTYLRLWFPLDAVLVAIECLFLVLLAAGARGQGFFRAVSVLRCAKVLRAARVVRSARRAMMWCLTFKSRFGIQVATFVSCTVLLNHVLCCAWWAMGTSGPSDTGDRWTDTGDHLSSPVPYQYLSSFHFIVAQLTLGSSDVMGTNSLERSYTCTLLFLALILGSCLISIISGQIVNLIMMQQDRTQELTVLRRFLRQENIPHALAADVQRQAVERLQSPLPLVEEDVKALGSIARSMRFEVKYEIRLPQVLQHPLFRTWGHTDMRAVKDLCRNAISFKSLATDDDLFIAGETAQHSYRILDGAARYLQSPATSMVPDPRVTSVSSGAWVAEAALWVRWKHVGSLTAKATCKILVVSAEGLIQVMCRSNDVHKVTRTYGQKFHQRVVVATPPLLTWPDDLQVPFTDSGDLLSSNNEMRLLKLAMESGSLDISQEQYDFLSDEVQKDKCSLSSDENGNLVRVVSLVTVKVIGEEGRVFALLGRIVNGRVLPACALPGCKRIRGELPQDSINRLLTDELAAFQGQLEMTETSNVVETRPSERYGIDTTYLKVIQEAYWTGVELNLTATRCKQARELPIGSDSQLTNRDVYVVTQGASSLLFSWVEEDEFEFFRSSGKEDLGAWLDCLGVCCSV